MALNKKQLKTFVSGLTQDAIEVGVTSRNEPAWAMVSPNRLVIALATGAEPGSVVEVLDINGNTVKIRLPEPEQLSIGAKAQPVGLVDDNGHDLLIKIETIELIKGGNKVTMDSHKGKGSPHTKTVRTKDEVEQELRHCVNCLATESSKDK